MTSCARRSLWAFVLAVAVCAPACHRGGQSQRGLPGLELPGGGRLFGAESRVDKTFSAEVVRALERERDSGTAEGVRRGALLAASRANWSEAARLLERSARLGLPPSIAANDRAAIALAMAATGTDPLGRVTALTATAQAIEGDPRLATAWYNRSLVLEKLQLARSAGEARRRYGFLMHPGTSSASSGAQPLAVSKQGSVGAGCDGLDRWRQWLSQEAAADVPTLPTNGDIQTLRFFLEDELLPAWAAASQSGAVGRERALALAVLQVANEVARRSGDPLPRESAQSAIRAGARGALAVALYGSGRASFRRLRFEECVRDLSLAARAFAEVDNPGSLRARTYRASCLLMIGGRQEAERELEHLRGSPYSGIRAHAAQQLGALWIRGGDPASALPLFRQAASSFAKLGELASLAIAQASVADALFTLGDIEGGWIAMEAALRTGARSCNASAHGTAVWQAGELLGRAGSLEAASAFQRESLALERDGGDPTLIIETLRAVALTAVRLHRPTEALAAVREARALLGKNPSASVHESQMAFLDWVEGTAISEREPRRAAALLGRALGPLRRAGREYERAAALLCRGRAFLAMGERQAAHEDFQGSIQIFEHLRHVVAPIDEPARSFADAEPAYDALTTSLLDQGLVNEALVSSERGRRQRGTSRGATATVPTASTTAVLYLDQLDSHLVAWWMTNGRVKHWTVAWSRSAVRPLVDDVRSAVFAGVDARPLRELATGLLGPVTDEFRGLDRIVVVAEDRWTVVPWSAMHHPDGGRWTDHLAVTVAPSLAVAIGADGPRPRQALGRRGS